MPTFGGQSIYTCSRDLIAIAEATAKAQQSDQCKLECYDYQKKSILFFNKFHLILFCLLYANEESCYKLCRPL